MGAEQGLSEEELTGNQPENNEMSVKAGPQPASADQVSNLIEEMLRKG